MTTAVDPATVRTPTVAGADGATEVDDADRRPVARWHLGRRSHRVVLIGHVLTSVGWFGLALTVAFLGIATAATDLGGPAAPVLRLTLFVSVPLGLVAATTGVVLSVTTRWGLVRYRWVVIKEIVAVAVILTDVLVVRRAIDLAIAAATPAGILFPTVAHTVLLGVATVLSIVKPRAKTAYGRRRLP